MTGVLLDTLVTGLPLVITYAGVFVLFRVLRDFDLTVDGSFVTGGAASAVLVGHGMAPSLSLPAAALAGAAAGLVTAVLHLTLKIPVLLAGLVMSLALFSVNLRIMGEPALSLAAGQGLLDGFGDLGPDVRDLWISGVLLAIDVAVLGLAAYFLRTEAGLALRATGLNPVMARAQGVAQGGAVAVTLMLANALAALGGALAVHTQGYLDVNGGTGTLIAGVGALLLGDLILRPEPSRVVKAMAAVLVGALLYQFVQVMALRLGLAASDLKLVTAATLTLAVAAQILTRRIGGWLPAWAVRRPRGVHRDPGERLAGTP
ncbi:ABC transporter permease [Actinocorallia aurea]